MAFGKQRRIEELEAENAALIQAKVALAYQVEDLTTRVQAADAEVARLQQWLDCLKAAEPMELAAQLAGC